MKESTPKYALVADISSYQPHSLRFFKSLKEQGVKAVIIKCTQGSEDGDHYFNPKFEIQRKNARRAGLLAHSYHYARFTSKSDAINEARWFIKNLEQSRVDKHSAAVIDVEDACLPKKFLTSEVKAFMNQVVKAGYRKVDIYSMAGFVTSKRLKASGLKKFNLWIASYGRDEPGVSNVGSWQFTDNFRGEQLDMSYDFKGFYTK